MLPLLRLDESPLVGDRRVHALALLSPLERNRFAGDPHRERFLTGRMLLRELASGFTGLPLESITISATCPDCGGPHGRPVIAGTPLFVSVSHAGGRTVAAICDDAPIGVDLESTDASPERLAAVREITGGEGITHWTRVEAVLKADGRGLRVDARHVEVNGSAARLDGARYDLFDASDATHVITVAKRGTDG